MSEHAQPLGSAVRASTGSESRKVIFASSLGTVFEWYDFFLYGALAAVISKQFFAGVNDTTAFIFALMAFAAGFVVRPFGALVFGRVLTLGSPHSDYLLLFHCRRQFQRRYSTVGAGLLAKNAKTPR